MPVGQTIRVRVAAPPTEARRLCTRLSRGGIPAEPDDGASRAEVLVAVDPGTDLTQYRGRVGWLVVLGRPGAAYFAAGADDVVAPGEPELLFRRLRAALERLELDSPEHPPQLHLESRLLLVKNALKTFEVLQSEQQITRQIVSLAP